jgi:methionyl-tRNA formyltransferase
MGSKPGSVVALTIMIERGWRMEAVVASQRNPHPWIAGPALADCAGARGIPVISQDELLKKQRADFVISYMFRNRVMPEVLALADRAAVNFHAAPLPEFAGWAFYSVAILENAQVYGCTCHHMDEAFDTGALLKVRRFPVNTCRETAYSLEEKTQAEMVRLFVDFCEMAESDKELPYEPQDKSRMRYLTRAQFDALKKIPTSADAETIDRYARAFWYPPYTCAHMAVGNHVAEVIPSTVREELATILHARDLDKLREIAASFCPQAVR